MLDPSFWIPVRCWWFVGEDTLFFLRPTCAVLTPADVGFDAQDMDACCARCGHEFLVSDGDEAQGLQLVCPSPVQCGRLAARDAQGRWRCEQHRL